MAGPTLDQKIKETEALVFKYLQEATDLRLQLSSDEEAYHIQYVAKKLTECSVAMEKLSDMQMALTKISLEVTRLASESRQVLRKEVAMLKANAQYAELPSNARDAWIQSRTAARERDVDNLNLLARAVSEVRGTISDRLTTMKRLDSDIRSHQKLIESGSLGSGVAGKFTGPGHGKDVEL